MADVSAGSTIGQEVAVECKDSQPNGLGVSVVVSQPDGDDIDDEGMEGGHPDLKAKRPSLSLPILRVEQLKEEGCSSPGSSNYNSEDSEFSDTDIISRLGEFVPPNEELAVKIAEQVRPEKDS